MVECKVRFADDELMSGRDWLMCHRNEGEVTLYIKRSAHGLPVEECEKLLEDAWSAFRVLAGIQTLPMQRVPA